MSTLLLLIARAVMSPRDVEVLHRFIRRNTYRQARIRTIHNRLWHNGSAFALANRPVHDRFECYERKGI